MAATAQAIGRRIEQLQAEGFRVRHTVSGYLAISCAGCAAAVVNGIPVHEAGCPRQRFECKGCNSLVARRGAYCEACR
jgi:hypothetical protein